MMIERYGSKENGAEGESIICISLFPPARECRCGSHEDMSGDDELTITLPKLEVENLDVNNQIESV